MNKLMLMLLASPNFAKLQRWAARRKGVRTRMEYDLVLIAPPAKAQGWILDAICREIAERLPGIRTDVRKLGEPLPPAECYFFSHYMFFIASLRDLSSIHIARNYVFATHLEPEKHGVADELVARLVSRATRVICMNQHLSHTLADLGVPRDRMVTVLGAADRQAYLAHPRQHDGLVGFCSAFYPRKYPDLVIEIVRNMPHRRFVLLGRGWQVYPRFAELCALPNFEYVEPEYSEYPSYYARMSVFVSVSKKEGGPIPLIEAMMSNVVPVASRTGFAPDLIEHGNNGFLFPIDATVAQICSLVDKAFEIESDIRATVTQCDWQVYAAEMARVMDLSVDAGEEH